MVYDVVWFRRASEPIISTAVAEDDRLMAFREADCQLRGIDHTIAPSATWVNAPFANKRASNKIVQLRAAAECGLHFPPTIFSNNPTHIRTFADTHAPLIYKPFYQASWIGSASTKSLLTTRIVRSDLNDDASLAACPGIFQKMVEKDYELRLTVMGDTAIGLKIGGYQNTSAATDWRSWAHTGEIRFDLIDVPAHIVQQSRQLMDKLGIVFGCLDFIVDADGAHHFLEVNPAGQFLWMEDALPALPMLQLFCEFLLNCPGAGKSIVLDQPVTFAEFLAQQPDSAENEGRHIATQNPFRYMES